ncbi:hypothetical protein [Actinoplanes couchii]|uniref:Peptidase M10 metallopeptidase domain-containing protein n=1 Tax=Actinoplanes couchii TaxID=403638 RepID=A0ABQ3XNP0_9ACTN|nr:hypothetical protein [Actinoplanes couchii]MDR6319686.1 hypothetical protein [Actinoplanes couchii]GID60093.1 hypothetical protein Aco03nite_084970 [Actinoplanes couchii]
MTLVLAAASATLAPSPALAGDPLWTTPRLLGTPIVYVEEHVGARFDSALRSSISFVDRYTGSDMRLGRCRTGSRCIRVIRSNATHGYGAWTSWTPGRKTTVIRLSATLARKNWHTRRSIIDHELGHANGARHNSRCTSRMWPDYRCRNKQLPARTFTKSERAMLAKW